MKKSHKRIKKSKWEFLSTVLILGMVVTVFAVFVFYQFNASRSKEALLSAPAVSGILPVQQVCLVNNKFMGRDQILVNFDEKTYYGCCQMCVDKIKSDRSVRFATDPVTGKEVDKAVALITVNPSGSGVLYFDSEDNYRRFYDLK